MVLIILTHKAGGLVFKGAGTRLLANSRSWTRSRLVVVVVTDVLIVEKVGASNVEVQYAMQPI
ncbi:uncharacterized protein N7529_011735 [Penicillium soppii]|jgi:hypothetical protein|uniref:uncharacterized protein n=1 Tax=Penicillium soppii TaxID=69789 RepID=UPI0025479555|nr:uncharacterized protein N7529_011735 [Penicillium soppii]KAJ5852350.1 hypothetical protein N7529_011735 [Penicillium soppii]